MSAGISFVGRVLRGFARFWWDFLVGDTPEIFGAVVLSLGVVALLSLEVRSNLAAGLALPVLAAGCLGGSLWRARRASRKDRP